MRLWMLGSGSGGNALLLECGDSRVLVDAGFGCRTLAARLAAIGVAPASIQSCVITHEHTDHVRGAVAAAQRWGWSLYASEGTARGAAELREVQVRTFPAGAIITVGCLEMQTVLVSHDAAEPVALVVTSAATGARVGICTDLGRATDDLRTAMTRLDMLVLESNHDEGMLRAGPYPPLVCSRIAGSHGHLSNRAAAQLARECVDRGVQHLVLAHLSERCNEPRLAGETMVAALGRTGFRGELHLATQGGTAGPFAPRGARSERTTQLALAL